MSDTFTTLGAAANAVVSKIFPFTEVDIGHRKVRHYESGVYVGLPDEDYFQDPALGSSDMANLLISAPDYWSDSLYNPYRVPDGSRYLDRGHGLHALLLRGPSFFAAHYEREIQKEDHADALVSMDDLKRVCESYGLAKSGTKDVLTQRLRDAGPAHLKIWSDLVDAQKTNGKVILKAEDYDRIVIADAMVRKNPALAQCFRNGIPEVAIFWEANGVRFRAKLDWLSMNSTTDLKSFSNKMRKPVGQAINSIFWGSSHHVQSSHYLNARAQMARLIAEGRVFGAVDRDWLARAAAVQNDSFVYLYHQLSGAVVTRAVWVRRGGYVDGFGSAQCANAAEIWKTNWDAFGSDFWPDMSGIEEITEDDCPGWIK